MSARLSFLCDCNGMLNAIRKAADPALWESYGSVSLGMDRIPLAVWYAKRVVRQARALGLYDDADVKNEVAA
jgi:hypothetical protein